MDGLWLLFHDSESEDRPAAAGNDSEDNPWLVEVEGPHRSLKLSLTKAPKKILLCCASS